MVFSWVVLRDGGNRDTLEMVLTALLLLLNTHGELMLTNASQELIHSCHNWSSLSSYSSQEQSFLGKKKQWIEYPFIILYTKVSKNINWNVWNMMYTLIDCKM